MKYHASVWLSLAVLLSSCTKDPSSPGDATAVVPAAHGVYILNEGQYGLSGDARLSLYDITRDTVSLDVVEGANSGVHLGDTGDDMLLYRDKLYVIMSGSENIVVLNTADNRIVQSEFYPGRSPYAMVLDSVRGKLYVTELYRNAVIAIDLMNLQIVDTVAVGANPAAMLLDGDVLYVCNGAWGYDRTVSVLSLSPLKVEKTLTIGIGPSGITRAGDGSIVVACTGDPFAATPVPGSLYRIDASTRAVKDSLVLSETLWGGISTASDGNVYFIGVTPGSFYGGPIHKFVVASRTLVRSVVPGTFYGIAVDAASGDLYAADAKNFASQGEVRIFTSSLTPKRTLLVQRGPAVFAFKR